MWKYDGNNWIWISGSNIKNQQGNYGQQGISNSSNIPGARYGSISWIDNNNLWLFGGNEYYSNFNGGKIFIEIFVLNDKKDF